MLESSRHTRFQAVYEANYARILGYALRRTASAEDAADAVANTFATAWRRFDDMPGNDIPTHQAPNRLLKKGVSPPGLPSSDPTAGEVTLWLYAVARRTLANHRRKEANRSTVIEMLAREYEEALWHDPLPMVRVNSLLADAWTALRREDQDLLGLVAWEALNTEQIAAVIGCPRSVTKVRIHRARKRFAKELDLRGVEHPRGTVKPLAPTRHVQGERAKALPDTEAM